MPIETRFVDEETGEAFLVEGGLYTEESLLVSKEEFLNFADWIASEAAKIREKQDDDGWITWSGGENPVPGKRVVVSYRGNTSCFKGPHTSPNFRWYHSDEDNDIIAYRVVE